MAVHDAALDAIKIIFATAVINGVLALALILIVLLLTSDPPVVGAATDRTRSPCSDG